MRAYTLIEGKLTEGIHIPGTIGRGRLLLQDEHGKNKLALVNSPAAARVTYQHVRLQSFPASKQVKTATLILKETEDKDDRALVLIDSKRGKMEYGLIPDAHFEELTKEGLQSKKSDLLCKCSPGANLVIKDPTKGTTRYVWNGEEFKLTEQPVAPT
jgi:hypothetical protein